MSLFVRIMDGIIGKGMEQWKNGLAKGLSMIWKSWNVIRKGLIELEKGWESKYRKWSETDLPTELFDARTNIMLSIAAQLYVDKEKCRLLETFRDECLIPRFKDDFDDGLGYLEDLNQFEGEIREIGEIFETLGLAKPRRGVSWVPRQKLRDIVDQRLVQTGEIQY